MEILLLVVAGVVLYYLYNGFQDYMKNPYKKDEDVGYKREYNTQDNPYVEESVESKIQKTEFGILVSILQCIANEDGKICKLEKELISNMLDDIANEMSDVENAREILQNIFDNNKESLENLAQSFANMTKGEYKKRLKVIEFLFVVAYADGNLGEGEREKIIDIAALFELNNDDFNKLYDDFETTYNQNITIDKDKALEILGLNEDYTKEDLESAYSKQIKEGKQNILLNRNLNKNFKDTSLPILRNIDESYKILSIKFENKKEDS